MNIVLFSEADFIGDNVIAIRDSRRLEHISQIHQIKLGETLKVGLLNGNMGSGLVVFFNETEIQLQVSLTQPPPAPLPVTLVLALPRPKMLKRTLQTISTLGVKKIYLINSYRVEKSYWQTPLLEAVAIHEHLLLGTHSE
jgi:RsmE family RNA methyltransferase